MTRIHARQVEAFRATMVVGSMTQAGEILEISQPAVSHLIADLEQALGFRLFERRRSGLVATQDARRLYAEVERSFVGLERIEQAARDISALHSGHLRIVAMPVFANGLLPGIIAEFTAMHPGITIALEGLPRGKVIDYMVSQQCDLGIGTLPAGEAGLRIRRLALQPALCVIPAGHRLAGYETIAAHELDSESFISFPRDSLFRYQVDAQFERLGVRRVLHIEASTSEAVCSLVAGGAGVSVITPFCPHLVGLPGLTFRPLVPALPVELGVLLSDLRTPSAATQRFVDLTVEHCHAIYGSENEREVEGLASA